MPLYLVSEQGQPAEKDRFIRAVSSSAAVAHVTKDRFKCKNIAKADDIDDVLSRGLKIERVTDTPAVTSDDPPAAGDAAATEGDDDPETTGEA